MGFSKMLMPIFFSIATMLFLQLSESATVVFDGVSEWKNPQLQIGDSVIFQHRYQHYNLYIFQSLEAFTTCDFAHATLLTKRGSSSYTWRTSRLGFFYFSFNNGSSAACREGQKLAVKVSPPPSPSPSQKNPQTPFSSPKPAPVSGGIVASSPVFPWPFHPRESISPRLAPTATPDGEGIPFINSNPAVPLPTGEVDSATIRPLPTSGSHQVVGFSRVETALICAILLVMMMVCR